MTQKRSLAIRLIGMCLCCVIILLLVACMSDPLNFEGYQVVATPKQTQIGFQSFFDLLKTLLPDSSAIVLATSTSVHSGKAQFHVDEILYGTEMDVGSSFEIDNYLTAPKAKRQYVVFLHTEDDGTQRMLNQTRWLMVEDSLMSLDTITIPLSMIQDEIRRLTHDIYLPSNFYYYNDFEELIKNSDYIFAGTVVNKINYDDSKQFSIRSGSFSQTTTAPAEKIFIDVEPDFVKKEDPGKRVCIISSPIMLNYTLFASNLQSVSYTAEDSPILEEGFRYIFFVINSPTRDINNNLYFVNNIQGFVPVMEDDYTLQTITNAAFTYPMHIDDIFADIEAILSGETESMQYEPIQLEEDPTIEDTEVLIE